MIPKQEPRMEWLDVVAAGFIYLGFLLFLVAFHIITINSEGDINTVLNYTFMSFVTIYTITIIFGFVGVLIQLFRWATWQIDTPQWKKDEMKKTNVK